MKFTALTYLFCAAAAVFAAPTANVGNATVSYDQTYDDPNGSMLTVACSDGANGLAGKYPTFGSAPGFPNIGGAFAVGGWDSGYCGTCWKLTWRGISINVLAVDHAGAGTFNIALEAMNKLTNNQAEFLGRVDVEYEQLTSTQC